jgi:hypothetical protein
MFSVGPEPVETVVKDQVTAPDRVHPFGGLAPARSIVKVQAVQLRRWADTSEWVRAAINHRRVQVSQSQWSVVPIDDQAKFDPQLQATIELMLLHPNNRQKTFRALIEPVIEDILVLDRGVIEKEITVGGYPSALHLVDGASIRTNPRWSGDPSDPRYSWWPNNVFVSNLLDTQIVLMMANPTSHRVDGFSPLEALKHTIDADLEARDFNKRMVQQTNPHGLLNLGENVGANVIDSFRMYWDAEVAGRKQMGIIGGVKNPQFINMGQSARDMQYMQWQVYLLRKIAAVFGIAPQDLGITFDVNRANATTQQELSEDRGLKPLLRLIEEEINAKVIADFARTKAKRMYHAGEIDTPTMRLAIALTHISPRDHVDVFRKLHGANILNLAFRYRLRSAKSTRDQADYNRWALGGFPWDTIDEVRAADGKGPVPGGDRILVMTPIGAMPLEMIGGQMVPQTEEQKRYLDGLFQNAPLVLGRGSVVAGTPPVAVAGTQERAPEPVVVTQTIEVDEDGEEIEN